MAATSPTHPRSPLTPRNSPKALLLLVHSILAGLTLNAFAQDDQGVHDLSDIRKTEHAWQLETIETTNDTLQAISQFAQLCWTFANSPDKADLKNQLRDFLIENHPEIPAFKEEQIKTTPYHYSNSLFRHNSIVRLADFREEWSVRLLGWCLMDDRELEEPGWTEEQLNIWLEEGGGRTTNPKAAAFTLSQMQLPDAPTENLFFNSNPNSVDLWRNWWKKHEHEIDALLAQNVTEIRNLSDIRKTEHAWRLKELETTNDTFQAIVQYSELTRTFAHSPDKADLKNQLRDFLVETHPELPAFKEKQIKTTPYHYSNSLFRHNSIVRLADFREEWSVRLLGWCLMDDRKLEAPEWTEEQLDIWLEEGGGRMKNPTSATLALSKMRLPDAPTDDLFLSVSPKSIELWTAWWKKHEHEIGTLLAQNVTDIRNLNDIRSTRHGWMLDIIETTEDTQQTIAYFSYLIWEIGSSPDKIDLRKQLYEILLKRHPRIPAFKEDQIKTVPYRYTNSISRSSSIKVLRYFREEWSIRLLGWCLMDDRELEEPEWTKEQLNLWLEEGGGSMTNPDTAAFTLSKMQLPDAPTGDLFPRSPPNSTELWKGWWKKHEHEIGVLLAQNVTDIRNLSDIRKTEHAWRLKELDTTNDTFQAIVQYSELTQTFAHSPDKADLKNQLRDFLVETHPELPAFKEKQIKTTPYHYSNSLFRHNSILRLADFREEWSVRLLGWCLMDDHELEEPEWTKEQLSIWLGEGGGSMTNPDSAAFTLSKMHLPDAPTEYLFPRSPPNSTDLWRNWWKKHEHEIGALLAQPIPEPSQGSLDAAPETDPIGPQLQDP
ncbi:hypothetical protein HNR46_001194 [Haloferula luteola]|uniref:Secreted protein n=1 Tax=Haloferula luteola TaxID=595692 RepID=A0A840VAJ0_9BACT|nr:hypothetical protein [Haloferula luteola]MBB5350960.1 hypothetical protein [Haloferula luteola]